MKDIEKSLFVLRNLILDGKTRYLTELIDIWIGSTVFKIYIYRICDEKPLSICIQFTLLGKIVCFN